MMAPSKRVDSHLIGRLFPKSSFRIAQLGSEDAKRESDNLKTLKGLLMANEAMYPKIDRWYLDKVIPGLKNSRRIAYVAFEGEIPIASAVLKLGEHAKFCHLRIHEGFQDLDLGQMFFAQMALEARHSGAKEIHFTLPEGLWSQRSEFFKAFGFLGAAKARQQYRVGETELSCSAPWATVWNNSLNKLPYLMQRFSPGGLSSAGQVLLSMQPAYAERVFARTKHVEIRKKFSSKWKGCKAVVYGSRPLGALMGEVTLSEVTSGSPEKIWDQYGEKVGCSREEFSHYVGNSREVYAVELSDAIPYIYPIDINQISHLMSQNLRPPQSFLNVENETDNSWAVAISVAGLLQGKYRVKDSNSEVLQP
jgi:predicted transcriptional regulator